MLTPERIRNIEFQKAGFSGFKATDVDAFIEEIATDFEELLKQKSDLIQKIQILADSIEEYRSSEETVKSAILNAQKTGDKILKETEEKARIISVESQRKANEVLSKSKEAADKLYEEASNKVRDILDEATMKANNIISDAEMKAKSLAKDTEKNINKQLLTYNYIKDEVQKFKDNTIESYKTHLELLMNISTVNKNLEDYDIKPENEIND